jgi:hypothetical protein
MTKLRKKCQKNVALVVLLLVSKRGNITKLKSGIYRAAHWSPQRGSSVRRSGSDRVLRGAVEPPIGHSG